MPIEPKKFAAAAPSLPAARILLGWVMRRAHRHARRHGCAAAAASAASHRECAIEDGHRLYMEIMDLVMYKHLYAMNAQLFSSS